MTKGSALHSHVQNFKTEDRHFIAWAPEPKHAFIETMQCINIHSKSNGLGEGVEQGG